MWLQHQNATAGKLFLAVVFDILKGGELAFYVCTPGWNYQDFKDSQDRGYLLHVEKHLKL